MAFLARILAPVEFAERCAGAVRYAKNLADHFGAELTLLHVVPAPPPGMTEEVYVRCTVEVKEKLENFLQADLSGSLVRRIVVKGDPARKIVQYALNEQSDVIVMATHGLGGFRRHLLGSNTAKVLHDADCPVWTGVHLEASGTSPAFPIRQILCAVDLGPQSANALAWASALQQEFDARLTLAHAALTPPQRARVGAPYHENPEQSNWGFTVRSAALKELEQLLSDSEAAAEILVDSGEPAQVISEAATRLNADILVIGRGSAAGALGRLRANAYAIIRQSPCPVVSV
jgi:nucleotide-binding universal stress UspA family protein